MKGDMRLLKDMPSLALAAGATIVGTGATPEGIDQNPAYYEYTFDTSWHTASQPLDAWFASYSSRRYGNSKNADAAAAWKILSTAVYNSQAGGWHDDTGVEWNGLAAPKAAKGINTSEVHTAWGLLVKSGLDATALETFNYDVVNTGREVLAQLITVMELKLVAAVTKADKAQATAIAKTLMDAYKDIDELVSCDYGFLLGPWIKQSKYWTNNSDGATDGYYEWQARSQVSTWWPVAPSARKLPVTFTKLPVLDNYANKHWNGLIRDFYAKRVQCYVDQFTIDLPVTKPPAPTPGSCKISAKGVKGAYLHNYPKSLPGSDGTHMPKGGKWPYDTKSLSAAEAWCCKHADCGGVTEQPAGKYEVRAGSVATHDPAAVVSYIKATGHTGLNRVNLTKCVTTAELDFTQGTTTKYSETPTREKTLSLSATLIAKYAKFL